MYTNLLGIVFSILFVMIIIGVSTVLSNTGYLSNEGSRKFIHIGVANWWIIAMMFFNNPYYAAVVPGLFVIINYLSYKKQIFKAMERNGSKKDLGTVYYAISLLLLALITFSGNSYTYIGAIGILTMGYGDGLAAVIGEKFGNHKFFIGKNRKSVEGCLTMFLASFLVSIIILSLFNPSAMVINALILAALATILEAVTPLGIDNLTVPIITALVYFVIK